ncbi:MAG: hypothetical protein LBR74_01270 [Eubacterium sp.]|jgi:hypothetical protein|nr:hypothetical protein [Eubacterium sp.]
MKQNIGSSEALTKMLINFLSQKSNPCSIVDNKLNIVWSNNNEFFTEIIDSLSDNYPEIFLSDSETMARARLNEGTYSVTITPYNDLFVLESFTEHYLNDLFKNSDLFSEKVVNSLNIIYSGLSSIPSGACHFMDYFANYENNDEIKKEYEAAERQYNNATNSLIEITRLTNLLSNEIIAVERLSIGEALDYLIEKAKSKITNGKERIVYKRDSGISAVKLSEKRFTLAFMEIFTNAMFYSPKDKPVIVELHYYTQNAHIFITNDILSDDKLPFIELRANLGIILANSILGKAKGYVSFTIDGNTAMTEMVLPIFNDCKKLTLSSKFKEYASDDIKPVNIILEKINRFEEKK